MLKPALDYTCWHLFYSLDVLLLPSLCHKDEKTLSFRICIVTTLNKATKAEVRKVCFRITDSFSETFYRKRETGKVLFPSFFLSKNYFFKEFSEVMRIFHQFSYRQKKNPQLNLKFCTKI
jgi:hypothetical protein